MALDFELLQDDGGEVGFQLPLLAMPGDKPSPLEDRKKRDKDKKRRRPSGGPSPGNLGRSLPECEEMLDSSFSNLPKLNRGSTGAASMIDLKKKSPEKSPLGRVTSWNEPKGKKLGGQGKKKSGNDMKMQLLDTPIMDLIDGDLLDIDFRVKSDESDFKRVLKKYETSLPAPTPLDTTPLLDVSATSPARLYNEIKGFEDDTKEGEWWDRWLTFTPPAGSKRREEQRQLTRHEQKAQQEQQRDEAEARAREIEEDLMGNDVGRAGADDATVGTEVTEISEYGEFVGETYESDSDDDAPTVDSR